MSGEPFVLDAYAARSCELKTVHAFTPGLVRPERDARPPRFFHDADAIEGSVFAQLRDAVESYVDLRALRRAPSAEQEEAALAAMDAGYELIVGPLLPRDWDAHRVGRPSALLRRGDGYVPVLVKFHRVLENGTPEDPALLYSTLAEPLVDRQFPGRRFRWGGRLRAALQAAHEWRVLEATGRAASRPVAGLIGLERLVPLDADSPRQHEVITWLDLDAPLAAPDPASAADAGGASTVSALQRYDGDHTRRVALASGALDGRGGPLPVLHRECPYCPWLPVCLAALPEDELSRCISKTPLDVHEVRTLRSLGLHTAGDLADADLDDLLPRYLPLVGHRDGGEDRLRLAQRRARLVVSGEELERTTLGAVDLPRHDLEIDLDIETSADDHVYLWGFHVDDSASGRREYVAFSRFTALDAAAELQLAAEAFGWLRELADGRDAVVYHYSDYETLRVARLAGRLAERGRPEQRDLAAWVASFVDDHFYDLFSLVRTEFFGANGLGLKVVASAGAGFHWRDAEPGGLASQTWFETAVTGTTDAERAASRVRVLEYNEDDVLATWHLRRWLRTLT